MSETSALRELRPRPQSAKACLGRLRFLVGVAIALGLSAHSWALPNYTDAGIFLVSVQVSENPPRIKFTWTLGSGGLVIKEYRVSRRIGTGDWGAPVATLPATATEYVEENAQVDVTYEYRVDQVTDRVTYKQRLQVAIAKPLIDQHGAVLLLVDGRVVASIYPELQRLKQDLVGAGWRVLLRTILETNTVADVKDVVRSQYRADPDLKALFIIGHVPVPYSGFIDYDGHGDHYGAWPVDAYYGDIDGVWTDTQVGKLLNSGRPPSGEQAVRAQNRNFPGDGKFDQNELPSDLELSVGRIDFYQMSMFLPKDEFYLLKQYLQKDHEYRQGAWRIPARGLVDANLGDGKSSSFSGATLRSFAALFGPEQMYYGAHFFPTVTQDPYLWSYVDGPGHWWGIYDQQMNSPAFVSNATKTVFLTLFGSYFPDFNYGNSPMKAALAAMPNTLAVTWPIEFQDMALGGTMGDAVRRYLNESRAVAYGLLGDPTLRLHVLPPPLNFEVRTDAAQARLSWNAPSSQVAGYHVYRAPSPEGPFVRLTESETTGSTFQDNISEGEVTYLIRAVALQTSGSGRYKNAGQGLLQRVRFSSLGSGRFAAELLATSVVVPPLQAKAPVDRTLKPIIIHGAELTTNSVAQGDPLSLTLRFSGGPAQRNYDLGLYLQETKAANFSWSQLLVLPIAPDQLLGPLDYPVTFRVPDVAPGEYRILVTFFNGADHPAMVSGPGATSLSQTRFEVGRVSIKAVQPGP